MNFKKIIIAGAAIAALAVTLTANAKTDDGINLPDNAVIYDCNDLTYDILTSRTSDIIVTYSIYNTENQYEDDITERYDMVVASDDLN